MVKRVQQITKRKKQLLYLLFVDLTAALDHVPRHWIFDSIRLRLGEDRILEKLRKLHLRHQSVYTKVVRKVRTYSTSATLLCVFFFFS